MEIISKKTNAEILESMAIDPVEFARRCGTDYNPRPCQQRMLRSSLDKQVSITSKKRQCGASETACHYIAWSLFAKKNWKSYIVAPNQWVADQDLARIYRCFDSTPLLRDNLKHCTKNSTEFSLSRKNCRTEVLLVGESSGNQRRGGTIKNGLILFEEIEDIPKSREVISTLLPAVSWGGGQLYIGTKRGFSGPFYDKFTYIKQQVEAGRPGYQVFTFPLVEFIAERHGGKGIRIDWLRDRKAEEPPHIWKREYCGMFAEQSGGWFDENDIQNAIHTFETEGIALYPYHDSTKNIILGIDWGLSDASALIYLADNLVEDRLEVIHVETLRLPQHCQEKDTPVNSYDDVVKMICNLRDRGLDPQIVYCDRNNKGGVYSDRLMNEYGFNVVDGSWSSNIKKTQRLRSLRNLIKAGRFIFPADHRLLREFSRFSPSEDPETGKFKFKEHNDDCIAAAAMACEWLAREEQPPLFGVDVGENLLREEAEDELSYAMVY